LEKNGFKSLTEQELSKSEITKIKGFGLRICGKISENIFQFFKYFAQSRKTQACLYT